MLFLLGIDSAFSFMEAFLAVLLDTKAFEGINRKLLSGGIAFSCFLFSLMYATGESGGRSELQTASCLEKKSDV